MTPLSVGMVVRNEARRLRDLLDVCTTFSDQFIVVDQQSDDDTADIAKEYGAVIISDDCHGYADPSRHLLVEHCTTEWMLMLDADELPTLGLRHALDDLMSTNGAYLKRDNRIGGIPYSEEHHYRLFPINNVSLPQRRHQFCRPLSEIGVVSPQFVALDHFKTLAEQELDDLSYEQLGQTDHRILDRLRALGISGEQADALPLAKRKGIVLGA